MSTPLSSCDISARYGQMPAPRMTPMEQTGWDFNQLFSDYMRKVRTKHAEDRDHAEEDALMAVIDAMNDDSDDGRTDQDSVAVQSLEKAGRAVSEKSNGKMDPTLAPSVRAILTILGDRVTFEEVDDVLENREEQEQLREEERLEVTEQRELSDPSDPEKKGKEV